MPHLLHQKTMHNTATVACNQFFDSVFCYDHNTAESVDLCELEHAEQCSARKAACGTVWCPWWEDFCCVFLNHRKRKVGEGSKKMFFYQYFQQIRYFCLKVGVPFVSQSFVVCLTFYVTFAPEWRTEKRTLESEFSHGEAVDRCWQLIFQIDEREQVIGACKKWKGKAVTGLDRGQRNKCASACQN